MIKIEELPTRQLKIIDFSDRSSETVRQRCLLLKKLFGPAGLRYRHDLQCGSASKFDEGVKDEEKGWIPGLDAYRDEIGKHFNGTVARAHSIPEEMVPLHCAVQQDASHKVIEKLVEKACSNLPSPQRRVLEQLKNEVKLKPNDPASLFKILALPEHQVDEETVFQVMRHLLIGDTAGPLDVRSKNAAVRDQLTRWQDIFNLGLFVGRYGEGAGIHRFYAYHDADTNKVIRFHSRHGDIRPPKANERLAVHEFDARRVEGYGLVYADIHEVDVVDATIEALAKAANSDGSIRAVQDVKGSMRMTFVGLEYQPEDKKERDSVVPHLAILRKCVMGVMMKYMQIGKVINLSPENQGLVEFYPQRYNGWQSALVPIRIEFLNKQQYLNRKYHVGNKREIADIGTIYDGEAEDIAFLRGLYKLVGILFPPKFHRGIDVQAALLETINKRVEEIKGDCTSKVTCLNGEEIKALLIG